ncbi:oxidoreductase, partial [Klebsiella aerogenes]
SRSAPPFAHEGFRHLAVDVSDRQALVDALSSVPTPQAIIHAAGMMAAAPLTVNVVAPGATDTPMLRQPGRESSPPKTPPLGRLIKPQEVVSLVSWLLSEGAAAMTGQELVM